MSNWAKAGWGLADAHAQKARDLESALAAERAAREAAEDEAVALRRERDELREMIDWFVLGFSDRLNALNALAAHPLTETEASKG